jgi:hypothetical protein
MEVVAKSERPSIKSVQSHLCHKFRLLRIIVDALAKIFVYSMSVDGEIREVTPVDRTLAGSNLTKQAGFTAGSRAVDSLDRMITSIESFFHPTNTGSWTLSVRQAFSMLLTTY